MEKLFGPDFWAYVSDAEKSGQRKGQAVYNAAAVFHPVEAWELNSTHVDPFYNDDNIGPFLEWLAEKCTKKN